MTNIYDLHDKAFANVSAYIITRGEETVAKIAFKFPRDGAGRLYAYVHWFGTEMVRGYAGGYGYDKKSAAVESAIRKLMLQGTSAEFSRNDTSLRGLAQFEDALCELGGEHWDNKLLKAGFNVWQAV